MPTSKLFDEISSYWAEIADASATEKQVDFVRNNVSAEGAVLDLCCGNGRHAVPLCKAGYSMVGLDISLCLLRIAKEKATEANVSLPLVRADMRFVPFRSGVFSAVVSLDSSFGYLPSKEEDVQSLKDVARTLAESGVFVVDVFNRERMVQRYGKGFGFGLWRFLFGLLARFPQLAGLFSWRGYPSFYLLQKGRVDSEGEVLQELWVIRDKKTGGISVFWHVVRLYDFSQLQTLLGKAGLQFVRVYGNYERQEYSKSSSRLIVIADKTEY